MCATSKVIRPIPLRRCIFGHLASSSRFFLPWKMPGATGEVYFFFLFGLSTPSTLQHPGDGWISWLHPRLTVAMPSGWVTGVKVRGTRRREQRALCSMVPSSRWYLVEVCRKVEGTAKIGASFGRSSGVTYLESGASMWLGVDRDPHLPEMDDAVGCYFFQLEWHRSDFPPSIHRPIVRAPNGGKP